MDHLACYFDKRSISTASKRRQYSLGCLPTNATDNVIHTVLDTNNLHFSEEFLQFPARADTDICADALGFSARYRAEKDRNSTPICVENG